MIRPPRNRDGFYYALWTYSSPLVAVPAISSCLTHLSSTESLHESPRYPESLVNKLRSTVIRLLNSLRKCDVSVTFVFLVVLGLVTGECAGCSSERPSSTCTLACRSCVCGECKRCRIWFYLDDHKCKPCSSRCRRAICTKYSGVCSRGCVDGFHGDKCNIHCRCPGKCRQADGACIEDDVGVFNRKDKDSEAEFQMYMKIVGALVLTGLIGAVVIACKRKCRERNNDGDFESISEHGEQRWRETQQNRNSENPPALLSAENSSALLPAENSAPLLPADTNTSRRTETGRSTAEADMPPSYESLFPEGATFQSGVS